MTNSEKALKDFKAGMITPNLLHNIIKNDFTTTDFLEFLNIIATEKEEAYEYGFEDGINY